jgi:glutamate synthase (NADPH/NADH) small chain
MPQPPLERAADNPWPEWPKVYRLDYGQEEAAARFGADPRAYLTTVKRLNGDAEAGVRSVTTVRIAWKRDGDGRFAAVEVPGSEQETAADLVLLALGFTGPEQPLLAELGIATDVRSNIEAAHGAFATNVPGIFAAGDCRRGQSLIVWAIDEGRGAARECDRYLMGSSDLP